MTDRAGSRDEHPPKLLYPDDYVFAVIVQPDHTFDVYQSRRYKVSTKDVTIRLRRIVEILEGRVT